jgi:hypothetical protein
VPPDGRIRPDPGAGTAIRVHLHPRRLIPGCLPVIPAGQGVSAKAVLTTIFRVVTVGP